jgi:hypothetical protein
VLCLYCGKSSWRPFRRAAGEFCSAAHRQSYNERLRKVAGQLAEYKIVPPEDHSVAADPVLAAAAELESRVPVASERFSILSFLPTQKPGEARMAPALPSTFETRARIQRWGLKMRFLKPEGKSPAA